MACLRPRNSITNVVASVTIDDYKYTYICKMYIFVRDVAKIHEGRSKTYTCAHTRTLSHTYTYTYTLHMLHFHVHTHIHLHIHTYTNTRACTCACACARGEGEEREERGVVLGGLVSIVGVCVCCGSVNGGWLGRVCTTLHLHEPDILTAPALVLFCFLSFSFVSCMISMWYFADMGSVLTKLLRAKYGAAEKEYTRHWICKAAKLVVKLAHPEFPAVYAESQDVRRERHDKADRLLGNFAVERDIIASLVLRDSLCHVVVMHLCITQVRLSVLSTSVTWFWITTLTTERHVHGRHAIEVAVLKVRGPHGLSVLPLQLVLFYGLSVDCASTLEKYGSLSTSDASCAPQH